MNLLLYSVFRIGNATNNISYDSFQKISNDPKVKWTIPLSLGDSHRGFRVLGTNQNYFAFFRYADKRALSFSDGKSFNDLYDAVIGRSGLKIDAEKARKFGLTPKTVTAFMLGLKKRTQTFVVQRQINEYSQEPLLAIIPGSTLTDLWRTLGQFEKILLGVSLLVLLSGLLSMLIMLLSTLNERRREMAILRAVGAHAYQVIILFMVETFLILIAGTVIALGLLYSSLLILKPILLDQYGFSINIVWLDTEQISMVLFIFVVGLVFSLVPGIIAYKNSLQD